MECFVCGGPLPNFHHHRKYCSNICRFRSLKKFQRKCDRCGIEFVGRKNQHYCSQKCSALDRPDHLRMIQEAKRKYPKIEGLTRLQLYRKFNPKKQREELNRDNVKRVVVIQYLGGKCSQCGYEADIRALQLDHVRGDGHIDRKKKGRSGKVYRYYAKNLEEARGVLQVLCANCHSIKSIEKGDYGPR